MVDVEDKRSLTLSVGILGQKFIMPPVCQRGPAYNSNRISNPNLTVSTNHNLIWTFGPNILPKLLLLLWYLFGRRCVCLSFRRVCNSVSAAAFGDAAAGERARGLHLSAGPRARRPAGEARRATVAGRHVARWTKHATQLSDGCGCCVRPSCCSNTGWQYPLTAADQTPSTYKKWSFTRWYVDMW